MVEQSGTLTLAELRQRIDRLMDRLEDDPSYPKEFPFHHDFYWTVSPEEAVAINASPTLVVGSLQDDVEHLGLSAERVTSLELEALASLLRYYSRLI